MKRTPLARKSSLKRGGRVKPINAKRRKSEFARTYGSKARVAWVKSLPCLVCGMGPSENAHVVNGGTGRKGDCYAIVPLCSDHHWQSHHFGWSSLGNKWTDARWRIERALHIHSLWERYAEGE